MNRTLLSSILAAAGLGTDTEDYQAKHDATCQCPTHKARRAYNELLKTPGATMEEVREACRAWRACDNSADAFDKLTEFTPEMFTVASKYCESIGSTVRARFYSRIAEVLETFHKEADEFNAEQTRLMAETGEAELNYIPAEQPETAASR